MSRAQLQKACKGCKPSSVSTYWTNIKSLGKLAGHDVVPAGGKWLNAKLLASVRGLPLHQYKRYATAGVKAAQMYGVKRPEWSKAMSDSTEKYSKIRETGKRTKREAANWPKDGYKALGKLAKDLHSELQHLDKKKKWSRSELYHYQKYVIVLFYSKHALRGDLADVRYKSPYGPNYIKKTKGSYTMHIGEHKTSRAHGPIELTLGAEITAALDVFLPQVRRLMKHGYLLSTLRTGNRLQRADMLKLIRTLTKERLGKNIGVQLIRVMKVSASALAIDEAKKLQDELGHSASMQRKYVSRG